MTKAATVVEAYGHIPLVRLDGGIGSRAPVGDGELVSLEFDAWRALDDEFPMADTSFERTQPLFYRVSLAVDDTASEALVRALDEQVRRVYDAVLLAAAVSLPSPRMSMRYIGHPDGGWIQAVGPLDREYVLYRPDAALVLDEPLLARVRSAHALLGSATVGTDDEVAGALAALERTVRPELTALNACVHAIVALEELLLPDVREDLTATFARRGTALVAPEGHWDEYVGWLRGLYGIRSRVLHGEQVDDDPRLFRSAQAMLASTIGHALAYCTATGGGLDVLRRDLDAVDAASLGPFRARFAELLP